MALQQSSIMYSAFVNKIKFGISPSYFLIFMRLPCGDSPGQTHESQN